MVILRRRLHLLEWALVALVGVILVPDVSSTCSAACCANRPASDCRCCDKENPTTRPLVTTSVSVHGSAAIVSLASRVTFEASAHGCRCRTQEPASPALGPVQRTLDEQRPNSKDKASTTLVSVPEQHLSFIVGQVLPDASPPRSPLYLRTSRLLI
jgi:hypothetical protein